MKEIIPEKISELLDKNGKVSELVKKYEISYLGLFLKLRDYELEVKFIKSMLKEFDISVVAEKLGMTRDELYKKLLEYDDKGIKIGIITKLRPKKSEKTGIPCEEIAMLYDSGESISSIASYRKETSIETVVEKINKYISIYGEDFLRRIEDFRSEEQSVNGSIEQRRKNKQKATIVHMYYRKKRKANELVEFFKMQGENVTYKEIIDTIIVHLYYIEEMSSDEIEDYLNKRKEDITTDEILDVIAENYDERIGYRINRKKEGEMQIKQEEITKAKQEDSKSVSEKSIETESIQRKEEVELEESKVKGAVEAEQIQIKNEQEKPVSQESIDEKPVQREPRQIVSVQEKPIKTETVERKLKHEEERNKMQATTVSTGIPKIISVAQKDKNPKIENIYDAIRWMLANGIMLKAWEMDKKYQIQREIIEEQYKKQNPDQVRFWKENNMRPIEKIMQITLEKLYEVALIKRGGKFVQDENFLEVLATFGDTRLRKDRVTNIWRCPEITDKHYYLIPAEIREKRICNHGKIETLKNNLNGNIDLVVYILSGMTLRFGERDFKLFESWKEKYVAKINNYIERLEEIEKRKTTTGKLDISGENVKKSPEYR